MQPEPLSAGDRYDLNQMFSLKMQMSLQPEAEMSQGMLDVDMKVCCMHGSLVLFNILFLTVGPCSSLNAWLWSGGTLQFCVWQAMPDSS